jgi:hypothetical protein
MAPTRQAKELKGFEGMQAVELVPHQKGTRLIATRWVVTGVGESTEARVVAAEVVHVSADASIFASTLSAAPFRT